MPFKKKMDPSIRTGRHVAENPVAGDEIFRSNKRRRLVVAVRSVGQNGWEIDYLDKKNNLCTAWATTWYEWAVHSKTQAQINFERGL